MSGTRFYRSWRGRLPLVATFMILISLIVVAPGANARAAVKQFTATIDPTTATTQVPGTWTETVTNCGGDPNNLPPKCTVSSTIGLGTIQITVPPAFRSGFSVASPAISSGGHTWIVNPISASGNVLAYARMGSDKLQPGESVGIAMSATPSTCTAGSKEFTTSAWGSTPTPGSDPFQLPTGFSQPTVTLSVSGCLGSGDQATGPGGQTETVTGFQGHIIVTFGGNVSCNGDARWAAGYHLPTQVNITPADDYVAGSGPKVSTSTFTADLASDSSWYRICYSTDPNATTGTILPPCYSGSLANPIAPPCVDKQYRDFIDQTKVVITVLLPGADPAKH
jgi:hypothetical protein